MIYSQRLSKTIIEIEKVVGHKFNDLTILGFTCVKEFKFKSATHNKPMVNTACVCGNTKEMVYSHIKAGIVKSCGCLRVKILTARSTKHGFCKRDSWRKEHKIWCGLFKRCYDKSYKNYKDYGGRGIKISDEWHDFKNFIEDMGLIPEGKSSIDRFPNKDGNYEKGNCRWADTFEQTNNRRNNRMITVKGNKMTIAQAERLLGFKKDTIHARVKYLGYTDEEAINTPLWAKRKK
jgi:hypothetical protein